MEQQYIIAETQGNVGIITLNRPETLNAINETMLEELATQLQLWDNNGNIGAMVLCGNEKAFAAGIDVNELAQNVGANCFNIDLWHNYFAKIEQIQKPLIAAVAGYALGIGCELALACDIILIADNARFGQPELSLGVIPGFGACAKLNHTIGKAKTMEVILSGRAITAEEAEKSGLASRVIALADLKQESIRVAAKIAAQPRTAVMLAKDTIKESAGLGLKNGIEYESKNNKLCLNSEEFKLALQKFNG